jgi:hypothetical protein
MMAMPLEGAARVGCCMAAQLPLSSSSRGGGNHLILFDAADSSSTTTTGERFRERFRAAESAAFPVEEESLACQHETTRSSRQPCTRSHAGVIRLMHASGPGSDSLVPPATVAYCRTTRCTLFCLLGSLTLSSACPTPLTVGSQASRPGACAALHCAGLPAAIATTPASTRETAGAT